MSAAEAGGVGAGGDRLGLGWWLAVPLPCAALAAWVVGADLDTELVLRLNTWPATTGAPLWANLTVLGDAAVAAALMLPFVGRNPRLVWAVLLATLLGVAAGELIGALVPRDRPPKVLGKEALEIIGPRRKHDAFPSGHTTTIFLAVALWVRVVPQLGWRLLLVLLAVAVGTSRVVVGVHWPTDVLAGAALGWCWGHLAWVLSGRWTGGLKRAGQLTTATILLLAAASLYGDDSGFDELLPAQLAAASVGILMGLPGWWRLVRGVSPDGRPPSPGGPPASSPSSSLPASGGPAG